MCPATLNAISHFIIPSVEIIGKFLRRTKRYQRQLSESRYKTAVSWQKIGWTLFKKDELTRLRDTLRLRLNSIHLLLFVAQT